MNGEQPGDRLFQALLEGKIDGSRLGTLLWQLSPALPHETAMVPLPLPRALAQKAFAPRPGEQMTPTTFMPSPVVEQGRQLVGGLSGKSAALAEAHHSNPGHPDLTPVEPTQAPFVGYTIPTSQMPFNGGPKHVPQIGESRPLTVHRPIRQLSGL
jgi:hypothetical protein